MPATQTVEQLAALTSQTAEAISDPEAPLDSYAAELLLRNTAVIADRLSPGQFRGLAPQTIDTVLDAAATAKNLAPLSDEDERQLPHESDADYEYRTAVWQPLHNLRDRVARGDFETHRSLDTDKLKAAVDLGSKAFAAVLKSTDDYPAVSRTQRYFWDNTSAAARRVEKSAR